MGTRLTPALRAQVAMLALDIPVGHTVSEHCPACDSKDKKLSITRADGSALFLCFRAACGFRGFVAIGEGGSRDMPRKPSPARPFNLATECPPLKAYRFANVYDGFARYTFADTVRDWGVSWAGDTIVYECRGFSGEVLGHVTRTPGKEVKTYRAREGAEMYAVYRPDNLVGELTVLVEDCVSAMCVASRGQTGVALLGTNLPEAVRSYLAPYRNVIVFLDPDAESKALRMADTLRGRAAIGYEKDPKDLPNLDEILRSYL